MGLTGTLHDGTRVEALALCEFESPDPDRYGNVCACEARPDYRVFFESGEVLNACEEHAQILWDVDEALAQEVPPRPAPGH